MPERLTEAGVKALKYDGKPAVVRDAKVTGLLVAVNKSSKSYKVQRDLWQGPRGRKKLVKTVRHTLGGTEEMTLDEARSRALAVLDQIKRGIDPNAPEADAAEDAGTWTVRRMFEEYGADMRARGCVERTIEDMMERLHRYLPKWEDTPITEVKRSAAREEHRRITERHGATTANKAMRDFRAAYNFALKVVDDPDALPGNPVAAVTFNKERASNRVIMPDDIADWWAKVEALPNPLRRDMHKLGLLSGLRPGTLVGIRRDWLRLGDSAISIPRMKSGRSFDLPLSAHMAELVRRALAASELLFPGAPWLFPTRSSRSGEVIATQVWKEKALPSETGHILRHTYRTIAQRTGIDRVNARLLLDHTVPGIDGVYIPNSQHNIRVALRRLGVSLWFDRFAERELVEGLDGHGPALDDAAAVRLRLEVDERFGFRPTKDFFLDVLGDHARRNPRHPVQEYLTGLRWDGVPRIGRWLAEYGGAADTPYVRAVGELVLVAAVRRVRQPGVKFDEMLVLESAQGTNKSTALKVLAVREAWFTDDLPLNAESKRVIEALSGKWIVEAGELKGMRKGGAEHLKGFLSRTHERARMSYDRREREVPRQCVIVGTTNDSRYLRDTTGNRRFWPVEVQGFDIDRLRRDRDQLWAEAAAREAEGVPIRLDPELWADAEAEQDARRVEDPFFERLHGALGEDGGGKLRGEDAWRIVGRLPGQRTQDDNERLGAAMRRLGFDRKQRRFGLPNPEWCYVRGDGNVPRLVPRFGPDGELEGVVLTDGGTGDPF